MLNDFIEMFDFHMLFKSSKNKFSTKVAFLQAFTLTFVFEVIIFAIAFYGPYNTIRDLWVTTAMQTMNHKSLAQILYTEEQIQEILKRNDLIEPNIPTDVSQLEMNDKQDQSIKVYDVSRGNFKAYLMIISNPSWIRVGISKELGREGQFMPDLVKDYGAVAALNGSGFVDVKGFGNGGQPLGIVVVDGVLTNKDNATRHNIIGFDDKNRLVLANYTIKEMKENNIMHCGVRSVFNR